MTTHWQNAFPRPIAFVLSGGDSLGAIQVGMLSALRDAGIEPDICSWVRRWGAQRRGRR